MSKTAYMILGCCILAFILGFSLVVPVFDKKTLLSHIQTYLEGDVDKNINILSEESPENYTGEAYHYWYAPENTVGIKSMKLVNWSWFWKMFKQHSAWQMEGWNPATEEWVTEYQGQDLNNWLNISKIRDDSNDSEKITLNFTSPYTTKYRFTFGIDARVKEYINRSGQYEYQLTYPANESEDYIVFFNWSDVMPLVENGTISLKHGVKNVSGKDVFWFRIIGNQNLQEGKSFEIDPTFGNTGESGNYDPIGDVIRGTEFTMTANGTITTMHAFLDEDGGFGGTAKIGYYLSSNQTRMGYTVSDNQADGWYVLAITSGGSLVNGESYYLVAWSDAPGGKECHLAYTAESGTSAYDSETYNGFPSPWAETADANNRNYCIYATYVAVDPTIASPIPIDGATEQTVNPTLNVTVNDPNGDTMTATWYSNSSGSWQYFATNSSVSNGTIEQIPVNFTSYNQEYWWAVNLTDGTYWVNESYSFTTEMMMPEILVNTPANGSTGVSVSPTVNITAWDNSTDAESLTMEWWDNVTGANLTNTIGFSEDLLLKSISLENNMGMGYFQTDNFDATVHNISAKLTGTGTCNVKCALYDNSSGTPTLVTNGVTEQKNIVDPDDDWHIFNFTGTRPILSANTWHYITAWASEDVAGSFFIRYNDSNGNGAFNYSESYNGYPATIVPYTDDSDGRCCIYASYNYTNPDEFTLQQTNTSVTSGSTVEWVYTNASSASTQYWWKAQVNNSQKDNDSEWFTFTTAVAVGLNWYAINDMTCNFSFGNTSIARTWQPLHSMLCNFSFGNTSIPGSWNILSGMLCNFSFGNTTLRDWNIISPMLCNFSFGNTSIPRTWNPLNEMLCNFSFGNTSIPRTWNELSLMYCNFSFGNTSIPRTWNALNGMLCNFSFGNTTTADTVTVTLIDHSPTNIRTNNTGSAWFLYNITTAFTPINLYSIVWAYSVNHTITNTRNTSYSLEDHLAENKLRGNNRNINVTQESKFNDTAGDGSIGGFGEWNTHDIDNGVVLVDNGSNWTRVNASESITEHLFNTISFVDSQAIEVENKTGQTLEVSRTNFVKIEFNMTDTDWYNSDHYKNSSMFFHLYAGQVAANKPLDIFYANSNYTTGDIASSPYCELVGDIFPSESYQFTDINSSYYEKDFIINETGFVGSVDATSKFYIILCSQAPSALKWDMYYADDNVSHTISGVDHYHDFDNRTIITVSGDSGSSWSANNSTPDAYFNYISLDEEDTSEVKLYANDTSGNEAWSSVHTDLIDITNYAPSPANIIVPNEATNYTVGDTIPINYHWIGDPNLDTCWVNISLWNWDVSSLQDYIVNQSITNDDRMTNNSNFTYNWDTTGTSASNYTVSINITDNSMWANHSSDIFWLNMTWQPLNSMLCNFSFGNTSIPRDWYALNGMLCNFSFGNTSIPRSWNTLSVMTCNFSFGNTSIPRTWQTLSGMLCNFSFGNTSIPRTWNAIHIMTCNFSFGNTSIARIWQSLPTMTCNFSFGNTSIPRTWNVLSSMLCNFSFGNTSTKEWNAISSMLCNFSFGNTSIPINWNTLNNMLCNFSFSNTSIGRTWNALSIMLCNFSFGNTSINWIIISNIYPVDGSTNIPVNVTLHIDIEHVNGTIMNITWYHGNSSANATHYLGYTNDSANGTYYMANPYANETSTTFWWRINVSDGVGQTEQETYYFETAITTATYSSSVGRYTMGMVIVYSMLFVLLPSPIIFMLWKRKRKRR